MEPSTVSVVDPESMTEITQIKTGSMARSERLSKYNQLIRIEENKETVRYAGTDGENVPFCILHMK